MAKPKSSSKTKTSKKTAAAPIPVSTGLVGRVPVGVQIVSGRYREDLCLGAGEAIEALGTPPTPVDPVG